MFLVPNVASIFCAAGMLLGDLKHDYIRSYITPFSDIDKAHFLDLYDQMKLIGTETLIKEGVSENNIDFYPVLDIRYFGQYHEVQLSVPWDDVLSYNLEEIQRAFHKEHNRLFGYSLEKEGTEIELINVRLRVLGITEKPKFLGGTENSVSLQSALKEKRQVYIPESNDVQEVAVYDGDLPLSGNTITGPAVIEKVNTSIFISESYDCKVDEFGSFIIYDKVVYKDGFRNSGLFKEQEEK